MTLTKNEEKDLEIYFNKGPVNHPGAQSNAMSARLRVQHLFVDTELQDLIDAVNVAITDDSRLGFDLIAGAIWIRLGMAGNYRKKGVTSYKY